MKDTVGTLYRILSPSPRLDHSASSRSLPLNGIYFFFEKGETLELPGDPPDRIVRIGTHQENNRFRDRIRQHYGRRKTHGGNKNASVFRKHLGGALLKHDNPDDPRLGEWITQGGHSFPEVEERVSKHLRDNFSFVCVRVDDPRERLALEAGLIGLFAQHPLGESSEGWLGRHAVSSEIRRSGLWNTQHLAAAPLTRSGLDRIEQLTEETLRDMGL